MSYWLKMIGADDYKLGKRPFDDWNRDEMHTQVRFPPKKTPRELSLGDDLIYYAVGYYRVFAHARVAGPLVENVPHIDPEVMRRWPDAVDIDLGVTIEDLADAPELRSISPHLLSEIHKGTSILPMGRPEFDRAMAALRKANEAQKLRAKQKERLNR
jgi:hypothetical protein